MNVPHRSILLYFSSLSRFVTGSRLRAALINDRLPVVGCTEGTGTVLTKHVAAHEVLLERCARCSFTPVQ